MTANLTAGTEGGPAEASFLSRIASEGRPTWTGFAINSGVGTVSLTNEFLTGDMGDSYLRALVFLGGILAVGALWLAVLHRVYRWIPSLSGIAVIGTIVLSGAMLTAGLNLDPFRGLLGIPPTSWPLTVSLLIYCLIFPWWVISVELLLSTRRRIRAYRRQLSQGTRTLTEISDEQARLIEEVRAEVRQEIQTYLSADATHLDDQLRREHDLSRSAARESLASTLHDTAHGRVRPLSHRMYQRAQHLPIIRRSQHLLLTILRTSRFHPIPISMLFLLTEVTSYVDTFGTIIGTVVLGIGITYIVVVSIGANALMARHSERHTLIYVSTLAIMQIPVLLRPLIVPNWDTSASMIGTAIFDAVAGTICIVVISGLGSWRSNALTRLEEEQLRLERERREQLHRRHVTFEVMNEAARTLHGSVQTRLTAAALALSQGGDNADDATILASLEEARSALRDPLPEASLPPESIHPLDEALHEVTRPWTGLCTITIDAEERLRHHPDTHRCALFVEEVVTNAVRHGRAHHIEITVRLSPTQSHQLEVQVIDDGAPHDGWKGRLASDTGTNRTAGLGTRFIEEFSGGSWIVDRTASGHNLLRARISARH